MEKIYFQEGENYKIDKNKKIKLTRFDISGKIEILDKSNSVNGFKNIEKISKKEYYDKNLEQLVEYNQYPFKTDESLRKSMKRLENKLKNNFVGDNNELFITLTTKTPVFEVQIIKSYFEQFWYKLKTEYDGLEYAYVLEKHTNRNSWHFHLLIKDMKNSELYIPNEKIEKLWGKGYTKTSRVSSSCKLNNEIDEQEVLFYNDKKIRDREELFGINVVIKYMCKLQSKTAMPKFIRCFETSRNLKSPEIEIKTYEEVFNRMTNNEYQLENEKTIIVRDVNTKSIVNKIKKETWSKKQ